MSIGTGLSNNVRALAAGGLVAMLVACGGEPEPDTTTGVEVPIPTAAPTATPTLTEVASGLGPDILGLVL